MTAVPKSSHWISPEEYLEDELRGELRHEYVNGAVYAKAGGSDDHNRIARNIATCLTLHLRGKRCEAFINDLKLKADSSIHYYPDVIVVCDPADQAKYFRERPSIIFEVLSPDTERTDRNEKKTEVLEGSDSILHLPPIKTELTFAQIYERTALARGSAKRARRDQN